MLIPYIILFAILVLVILGLLTWVIDLMNKDRNCNFNPKIWCDDGWRCQKNCENSTDPAGNPVSPCFEKAVLISGLASCLYGTSSVSATYCVNDPTDKDKPLCDCPDSYNSSKNCLANCGSSISSIGPGTLCCCDAQTTGNPYCTDCSSEDLNRIK
jgi:hypothetical protein